MEKIRILFLSANPWTTSRILVDEEAREVFERIQEGPYRDRFELYRHTAIRTADLQRLLLMYKPNIVHFSGHASKKHKLILGGTAGRGKEVDREGLVEVLALYKNHVRLVLLNACFTRTQARSIAEVIDYSVGTGKGIGDKAAVAFAGAFYRALGFGRTIKEAFESAKAELGLTKMPRTQGIELFIRDGISENDPFPQADTNLSGQEVSPSSLASTHRHARESHDERASRGETRADLVWERTEERFESQTTVFETSSIRSTTKLFRSRAVVYVSRSGRTALSDAKGNHLGGEGARTDGAANEQTPSRLEEFLASQMGQDR
ncbi:MAG TPA: CHAT domain-containing protein [Pyrinomonadaceae bacterium]|nr:CHAT domain-containing protein [Pyrinomonadaceae bacterium]